MTGEWTEWREERKVWNPDEQDPYINWWQLTLPENKAQLFSFDVPFADPKVALFDFTNARTRNRKILNDATERQRVSPTYLSTAPVHQSAETVQATLAQAYAEIEDLVKKNHPIPTRALNASPPPDDEQGFAFPNQIRATPPPAGTAIIGVIDEGISLCHDQFKSNGKTRILGAWQQSATWVGPNDGPAKSLLNSDDFEQPYLPYGRELYQDDIDRLLKDCTTEDVLDQDLFHEAVGLVDFSTTDGQRSLANRASHGTHVADIAGGSSDAPLMFVNLPNRDVIGLSGTFLEYFFVSGLLRMISLADRLWFQGIASERIQYDGDAVQGYPMVFNLSFSKSAGARDAFTMLSRVVAQVNKIRADNKMSRFYLSLPTGNDNLLEGFGSYLLGGHGSGNESQSVAFNLLPEDQSPSYIEIWSHPEDDNAAAQNAAQLEISVQAPGMETVATSLGENGFYKDLSDNNGKGPIARLYATTPVHTPDGKERRVYHLAIAPVLAHDPAQQSVPAGEWKINLRNASDTFTEVTVTVQSDQSTLPSAHTGLRPKLVDHAYLRYHEDTTRLRDSYLYETDPPQDSDRPELPSQDERFVFRHGSVSSVTAAIQSARQSWGAGDPSEKINPFVITSSGHRETDGRPAEYASTASRQNRMPDLSYPTEDSAALFGVLAAGASRGSKVAFSGTSFACAQATRVIASILTQKRNGHDVDIHALLDQTPQASYVHPVAILKSGRARMQRQTGLDSARLTSTLFPDRSKPPKADRPRDISGFYNRFSAIMWINLIKGRPHKSEKF